MNTQAQVPGSPECVEHLGDVTFLGSYLAHWGREAASAPAVSYHDHSVSRHGTVQTTTFGELDLWTRALAARITELTEPGDRVAILTPQSGEYVAGFLAAMRTAVINVPLFAPDLPGQASRLEAVMADCTPTLVLTTRAKVDLVRAFVAEHGGLDADRVLCIDDFAGDPDGLASSYIAPSVSMDDVAYLQYTSGSTRLPAGVVLTHRNLVENAFQLRAGHRLDFRRETCVSWLPLFHDMGLLIGICGPIIGGFESVLLDPVAFIIKPRRWLEALDGRREVMTAAPNFAFDYVVKRVKPEDRAGLDLSGVRGWSNGAEPILPETLDRFVEAFSANGVVHRAMKPTYGLAEATVFVSVTPVDEGPTIIQVDAERLQHGIADRTPPMNGGRQVPLVSSGTAINQLMVIADPDTGRRLADGIVGEIWLRGPNVGQGYWQKPAESVGVFGATLGDPGDVPADDWLRTGDLGFLIEGRIFVTGRIKDLIIIDGRNVYPHDVEYTVDASHPALAQRRLAAFSVPGPTGESIVVVAERYKGADVDAAGAQAVAAAARAAVSQDHAVALHDFVLVEPGTIPWTSSGKIARAATRTAYLDGALSVVGG
ncbi:MAG: fatty acyl-AMP ligase [Solirubrobacteraceae bacterium]|nr:fatty acyl-AMP ligase [Patulibacter sp.]